MRHLAGFSSKLLKKAAVKRGFAEAEILAQWHKIVPNKGVHSRPIKLSGKVLSVVTSSSSAAQRFSMQKLVFIEKINTFMGYEAVKDIRFMNGGFVVEQAPEKQIFCADEGAQERARARCEHIQDEGLREKLERLGALVEMENMVKFKGSI